MTTVSFWRALPQPIIGLAPMDGVTDAAFRLIVARHGVPDVTFTEFTHVTDICRGPEATLQAFLYSDCERPIVAQLYGKDPALFYQAAHVVCELGFDGLDINMGCPSRSVASSGSGAGLIRTPDLAREIIRATRQGVQDWASGQSLIGAGLKPARAAFVSAMHQRANRPPAVRRGIPLSIKTRIGCDSDVVEAWISDLLDEEPAVISLHGRTLAQMYRGPADWGAIARAGRLAQGTRTLLLGNGDIQSLADVIRRVRETSVHGVLVGRGALGEPWLFRQKEQIRTVCRMAGTTDAEIAPPGGRPPGVTQRFGVMLEHARAFEMLFGASRFPRMRKHLGWYCRGFPGAATMRAAMVRASSSADVELIVTEYLRGLQLFPSWRDPADDDSVTGARAASCA
jgi:nifR3 family TIM-barrel protein